MIDPRRAYRRQVPDHELTTAPHGVHRDRTSSPLTPAVVTLGPGPHNVEIMVIENFGYNQTLYYDSDFKQVVDFTVG